MFPMDILPVHILLVDMLPVVASMTNTHKDMCNLEIREVISFRSHSDLDLQLMGMRGMN
jgi:hypothetical protein